MVSICTDRFEGQYTTNHNLCIRCILSVLFFFIWVNSSHTIRLCHRSILPLWRRFKWNITKITTGVFLSSPWSHHCWRYTWLNHLPSFTPQVTYTKVVSSWFNLPIWCCRLCAIGSPSKFGSWTMYTAYILLIGTTRPPSCSRHWWNGLLHHTRGGWWRVGGGGGFVGGGCGGVGMVGGGILRATGCG